MTLTKLEAALCGRDNLQTGLEVFTDNQVLKSIFTNPNPSGKIEMASNSWKLCNISNDS